MSIWNIILIILAIVNIIAFASAIWVSSEKWKKGEKEWEIPLEGLFFIPLCIIIALTWPYFMYKENRKKFLEEERREAMRKRQEVAKKYHLQQFGFRLKSLPFKPISQEIIYVENEYNERINQIIKDNLEYIQKCLDESKYFKSQFVYLPNLKESLAYEKSSINYIAPYKTENTSLANYSLKSSSLLDYMANPENRSKITPCFARYRGEESGCSIFECVGFEPEDGINEKDFINLLCSTFDHYPMSPGRVYQKGKTINDDEQDADARFEKATKLLLKEVEDRIRQLRKIGVSQWALEQLVKPELKLSRLVITKDMRIILPDYNDMEIKMEPINKAVFLLFLKHPEGIAFKCLSDYRKELADIYLKIKPLGLNERVLQSIEDVTNPLLNSINEKCARIRGTFISQFDERLAKHYYIYGMRGEPKKIAIPRDMVTWE